MFFLDHIWIIPLLPAFGAAMMFFFGRKMQKATVNVVCVGVIVLAFLMSVGTVWQYADYAHDVHGRLLHLAAEEEHHGCAEGREQRNDPDVVEEEHFLYSNRFVAPC